MRDIIYITLHLFLTITQVSQVINYRLIEGGETCETQDN